MSSHLRRAAVTVSAAALVCFCSCERHKVGELPSEEEHAKPGADEKHHSAKHAKANPADVHANDGHKPAAPAHPADDPHVAPATSPAGTPAQFFPATSPSPQ
jgi:hypothetical protein